MRPCLVVIMGVSGCGKTTAAEALAGQIGGRYLEGDDFHPRGNKEKMGAGIPLTDEDRWPWYEALNRVARETLAQGSVAVMSCSALKRAYRDILFRDLEPHRLVYLEGDFETIKGRMDDREHEYMTSTLLESQFATLETPSADEEPLTISITETPTGIVASIRDWAGL